MKALDAKWTMDERGTWLNLLVDVPKEARQFVAGKKEKPYTITLKEWREKRSLDANAYAWVLIHKLSAVLSVPPEEIYRQHIRDVGDNSDMILVQTDRADAVLRGWSGRGTGWIAERSLESREHPGYCWVTVYSGSSAFDTGQMSRFIGFLVDDCKENGVEYLTPEELERMLARWETK